MPAFAIALTLLSGFALSACSGPAVPVIAPIERVGADRDAHGCIGSAGYSWCERESACVRPWELAQEMSLPNTPEAFSNYCASSR
ncbi:hypothetical protein [Fluviicoccus keumensis]|nr:hypothetical protein [Fluviicoccus keumensis]